MVRPGAHGADLAQLASHLLANGPRRVCPAGRRLRVVLGQATIVDTTEAVHVWEHGAYPHFYVPLPALVCCSVRDTRLVRSDGIARAAVVELTIPARKSVAAAGLALPACKTDRVLRFTDDRSLGALTNLVRLEFGSMDQWLEDVPVYVHPKDPFKRIDTLLSSRAVEVRLAGRTLAKSAGSVHLLETGLPARYYISPGAVDRAVLRKSKSVTSCPYKGDAEYYDVVDGHEIKDLVWQYRLPAPESAAIAGRLCFYNENVDIFLDGALQPRPEPPLC